MLFAGAFAVRPQTLLPVGIKTELKLALSRRPRPVSVHDAGPFFLAGADVGALPTFELDGSGSLSALCGDPLFVEHSVPCSRKRQLALLHAAGKDRKTDLFRQARGTYCFIHYNAPEQRLWLVADPVGLRPIYYTLRDDILVFASALRILEAVSMVEKRLSLEGMAELCGLDYHLGERTPYENIFVLRESELVEVTEEGVRRQSYDDWSEPDTASQDLKANAAHLAAIFKEAVDLRAGGERNAYAFLSGGLDSRSIVAALLARGIAVTALNFSPAGSQDRVFAEGFARAAGASLQLHCLARGSAPPNFYVLVSEAMATLHPGEHPRNSIWSGDGGSLVLGHNYMNEVMLDRVEAGDLDGTVRLFLSENRLGLPTRIFTKPVRRRLEGHLVEAITEELKRHPRRDRGRSLYLFLLFNNQRRHLFQHFETMDEHGLESLLPFYDAVFLKAVAATPIRSGILHRLYMVWLEHLPSFSRATPWQTYPGHVPCPLPFDANLSYQWEPRPKAGLPARHECAQSLLESLAANDLPPDVFSRGQLALAAATHLVGARDFEYVLKIVRQFRLHHRRCNAFRTNA